MNAFGFIPGYEQEMVLTGKEPLILLLLAFLITFACTRLYTRLARVRGWGSGSAGGVHLHHMVIGILMILVTGLIAAAVQPDSPGREIVAIFFGAGAALTLDEFALWLYLRDVYWCPEGRSSIDAIVMGVLLAALLLVGTSPFGIGEAAGAPRAVAFGVIAFNVILALVTFLKGKLTLGMLGVFVPVVGLIGAIRLAKPRSLWAKWFYRRNEAKMGRAHARFDDSRSKLKRLRDRFDDLIGGNPSFPMTPLRMEVVAGRLQIRTADPEP